MLPRVLSQFTSLCPNVAIGCCIPDARPSYIRPPATEPAAAAAAVPLLFGSDRFNTRCRGHDTTPMRPPAAAHPDPGHQGPCDGSLSFPDLGNGSTPVILCEDLTLIHPERGTRISRISSLRVLAPWCWSKAFKRALPTTGRPLCRTVWLARPGRSCF